MTMTAETEERLHELYREYLMRMSDHGCDDIALPFAEWVELD